MDKNIFDSILENTFSRKNNIKDLKKEIQTLSQWIVKTLKNDGRIIFIGAGISSEMVRIIIEELWFNFSINKNKFIVISAAKKYIDDVEKWKELEEISSISVFELDELNLKPNDLIIGITCSGKTEYVMGALSYAHDLKCKTSIITENKQLNFNNKVDLVLCPKSSQVSILGLCSAEGGSIQKILLDLILYGSMEEIGRIWNGYLIFMKPVSKKLYDYCIYTLMKLLRINKSEAIDLFTESENRLEIAILSRINKITIIKAEELIENNEYDFRKIILKK